MENSLVTGILDIVENKLREFGIQIPDDDRDGSTDPIVGYQYAELHDKIQEYLEEMGIHLEQFKAENESISARHVTLIRERRSENELWADSFWVDARFTPSVDLFRQAVHDYLKTPQGKEAVRETCDDFNWGDAMMYVPNDVWEQHGIYDGDNPDVFALRGLKQSRSGGSCDLVVDQDEVLIPDNFYTDYSADLNPEAIEVCCYIDDLAACEYEGVVEVDVEGGGALHDRLLEYLEAMEYDIDLTKTEFFVTYDIATREVSLTCDFDWKDAYGSNYGESSQDLLMPHEQAIVLEALDNWSRSKGFASFEEQVAVQVEGKKPSLAGRIGAAEAKATASNDDTRDVPEKESAAR